MKKQLSIILALAVCVGMLALTGCGGKASSKAPYLATVEKAFISGSYDGDVLVVNLDVTNNSKEYVDTNSIAYNIAATLDGTPLSSSYLGSNNPNVIENQKIAPEGTGKAQAVFKWNGETEGELLLVGVTYNADYSAQVEFINETINIAEVEKVVSESEYALTIDNVLKTDDGEGNDLLVVDMTFTNNSDEATSFGSAISLEIFQNNVSLKTSYLPYKHPANDEALSGNNYLDIKGSASTPVRMVFVLNDASAPIDVKAIDSFSYDDAIVLEKTIQL